MLQTILLAPFLFFLFTGSYSLINKDKSKFEYFSSMNNKLYDSYLADPRFPQMKVGMMNVSSPKIPKSGKQRFDLDMGAYFSFLRFQDRGNGSSGNGNANQGMEWNIGGAYFSQFDMNNSLDQIGFDGVINNVISIRLNENIAIRTGVVHISSHLGDEYIEKTNKKRIGYTRNEHVLGISLEPFNYFKKDLRFYTEIARDYEQNQMALNKPWRIQLGTEYFKSLSDGKNKLYFAFDYQNFQEDDWRVSADLQTGIIFNFENSTKTYRLGIDLYSGKNQMREFYNYREKHIAVFGAVDF